MNAIDKTLAERGKMYGDFEGHALITQAIKEIMQHSPRWGSMRADQREALEMVAHKVGRILNGDPNYADSWHDIAGYAQLVVNRLAATRVANSSMTAAVKDSGGAGEYVDRFAYPAEYEFALSEEQRLAKLTTERARDWLSELEPPNASPAPSTLEGFP